MDSRFQEVLFGKNAAGARVNSTSLWDIASKNYVAEATGNFRIIAPGGIDNMSVFVKSELPALLSNTSIGEIDGIPRSELAALGESAAKNAINLRAAEIAHFTQLSATNTDAWVLVDEAKIDLARQDKALLSSWAERQQTLFNSAEFKAANTWMGDLFKRIDSIPGASRLLKAMGPIGLVTSFLFASDEAAAANSAGNPQRAKDIMAEWAVENAGSEIGASLGTSLGALAVGVAALAGVTITAPVAAAVVFGSMLAGGYFGGEGGKDFYQLLGDRDGTGKRDIIDKLSNLFFGANATITTPLPADLNGDKFTIDASLTRDEMVALAKGTDNTGMAWRYALRELNSFVISDVSYAAHNTDGSLNLYDKNTNPGGLTDEYLADRGAMLAWKLQFEKNGARDDDDAVRTGSKPYNEEWDSNTVQGNWDFLDLTTKLPGGAPLQLIIDGAGLSQYDHQVVFGSKEADTIDGSGDSDRLYGMAGDDTLDGKAGADYLEGGAGTDTYQFNGNWGGDTILDSDGKGVIKIGSTTLSGGKKIGDTTWESSDGNYLYTLQDGTLVINQKGANASAGSITVKNWSPGQLGLNLADAAVPAPVKTVLNGDFVKAVNGEGFYLHDASNYIGSGQQEPGAADLITGSGSAETINGLGGNDALTGLAGDDVINGGTGNDLLYGGLGADTINGGDGIDTIYGSETAHLTHPGNATAMQATVNRYKVVGGWAGFGWTQGPSSDSSIWGAGSPLYGPGDTNTEVGDAGNTIDGGAGNDDILAGTGNDLVHGGADDDQISGMGGSDILFGDAGNDKILGDGTNDTTATQIDRRNTPAKDQGNDVIDGGAGDDEVWGQGGDDVVFGGSGNDTLLGDDTDAARTPLSSHGTDYLDGGAGNDQMAGGEGSDMLFGGTGDDVMLGDAPDSTQENALDGNDTLDAGDGNDYLIGQGGNDTLLGGAGNDYLHGGAGADRLEGGDGLDVLFGGEGNDTLVSQGADYLDGGAGDDVFELAATGGVALIGDTEGTNVLAGVYASGVQVLRTPDNKLYVAYEGGGVWLNTDAVLGAAYVNDGSGGTVSLAAVVQATNGGRIRRVNWDGTAVVDSSTVTTSQQFNGSVSNDELQGGSGSDLLNGLGGSDLISGGGGTDNVDGGDGADELLGGAGADLVVGGAGSDVIDGGTGTDWLQGGTATLDDAHDVYTFALGDGGDTISNTVATAAVRDTLRFGNGITSSTLSVTRASTGELTIGYGDLGDFIVFTAGSENSISTLEFADGGSMTMEQVLGMVVGARGSGITTNGLTTTGTSGNDTIIGTAANERLEGLAGDDVLEGGAGNDVLLGGAGHNTYRFGANSGTDVIVAQNAWMDEPSSVLVFEGVDAAAMRTLIDGTDLIIETGSGSVRLQGYVKAGSAANGWTVKVGDAPAQGLASFVDAHRATESPSLTQRQARFEAQQLAELRTLGTRQWPLVYGGMLYNKGVVPESVVSTQVQLSAGGGLGSGPTNELSHYLQVQDNVVVHPTVHHIEPTFGMTTKTYGGEAQYTTVVDYTFTPTGSDAEMSGTGSIRRSWPPGVPVHITHQVLTGYSPTTTVSTPTFGWREYDTGGYTEIVAHDTATQTTVTGTDGDDVVSAAMQADGDTPALFRGTISTGAGNDSINLGSGDEWVPFDLVWINYARQDNEVVHHERGLGAWIDAGSGDDVVHGTDGADTIIGGTGNDVLDGQAGGDTYLISARAGEVDHITDHAALDWTAFGMMMAYGGHAAAPNRDVVEFDDSVQLSSLSYRWRAPVDGGQYATLELLKDGQKFLEIDYDPVAMAGQVAPTLTAEQLAYVLQSIGNVQYVLDREVSMPGVERFTFSNGSTMTLKELLTALQPATQAPTLLQPLPDASLQEDSLGNTTSLAALFKDPQDERLQFSARLANGDALPAWLSVNAATGVLSGTPANDQVGVLQIVVSASNTSGLTTTAPLKLTVLNTNDAPVVALAPGNQAATQGQAFSFALPGGTFTDVDAGDTLSYTATLADGSALPSWLRFDSATRTLIGLPGSADVGTLSVTLVATDVAGAHASTNLSLTVTAAGSPANDSLAGNDTLSADTANTPLHGGAGNDTLTGSWASSTLYGDSGDDVLSASGGPSNLLDGGDGNDTLTGGWGQDTLRGGEGNNTITAVGGNSIISAGAGDDKITSNWGDDQIDAGDGNNTINASGGANTITTGSGNDIITADGTNTIHAGAGNDQITTTWGADNIDAGAGDDTIRAGGGGNTIRGGLGNDQIISDQWSDDQYVFARGDGQDVLLDSGGQDTLTLENVRSDQLWFTHVGNDLEVSVIGTQDHITLQNWYLGDQYAGAQYHMDKFKTSDGKVLLDSQVQALVQAMAAFSPPPAGQTTLAANYANTLNPVLAANWQ